MEELYRNEATKSKYFSHSSSMIEFDDTLKAYISDASISSKSKMKNTRTRHPEKESTQIRENKSDIPTPTVMKSVSFELGFDQMDWAKRVFYTSTERIFPGFRKSSENRKIPRNLYSARIRSSLPLCMLQEGSYYFNIPWGICFLISISSKLQVLKDVHGGLLIACSVFYFIMNLFRLKAGYYGNYNDDAKELGLYWMISALIQVPLITFLLMTDCFSPAFVPYSTVTDIIAAILLAAELLIGFVHLNLIISGELQVAHIAHETWKTMIRTSSSYPNHPGEEYYINWLDQSSEEELPPITKPKKHPRNIVKNSSINLNTAEFVNIPPKTSAHNDSEQPKKFFPKLKSKGTGKAAIAKIKKSSSASQIKELRPKKSTPQDYSSKAMRNESRQKSDRVISQELVSQQRGEHKSKRKRKTDEQKQTEYIPLQKLSRFSKEPIPTSSKNLEYILQEEKSDSVYCYFDKKPHSTVKSTPIRKSVKFTESSKQNVPALPMEMSPPIIKTKISKDKIPVAAPGKSTPTKSFVRDEINLPAPTRKVSSDVISETNTASKDSLPFSNLEESEAAYMLDVLSDYESDRDRDLVARH